MKIRKVSALVCAAVLVAVGFGAVQMGVNPDAAHAYDAAPRLQNAGFDGTVGSVPDGWTVAFGSPAAATASDATVFSGATSLHISDTSASASVGLRSSLVPVTAGTSYRFSAEVWRNSGFPQIYAYFYNEAGTQIASSQQTFSSSSGSWTSVAVTAVAPTGAVSAALGPYSGQASVTDAYFDNASIEPSVTPVVQNASFETPGAGGAVAAGWSTAFGSAASFSEDTGAAHSGASSLLLSDTSATASEGLRSAPFAVTGGQSYTLSYSAIVTSGIPQAYVYFYDASGAQLSATDANASGSADAWADQSLVVAAPSAAATAAIMFYSSLIGTTTANFDDVSLEPAGSTQALGNPVTATNTIESAYGTGPAGQDWTYTVANGSPATLSIVDVESGDIVDDYPLPGADGAYGVALAPDGDLYVGTYGVTAHLFVLPAGASSVTDLGAPQAGASYSWGLAVDSSSNAYLGTYPTGTVVEYDRSTSSFVNFGSMGAGLSYVHSVAVVGNTLYAGTGTTPHLFAIDLTTKVKTEIALPSAAAGDTFVYWLNAAGNYLFVSSDAPQNNVYVYDTATATWTDTIHDVQGYDVSQQDSSGLVYLMDGGTLHSYDPVTKALTSLGFAGGRARGFGFVHISDPDFPGTSISSMEYDGKYWIYNLSTGHSTTLDPGIPAAPLSIRTLASDSSGVYATGFLSGGLGRYDAATGVLSDGQGLAQGEGMAIGPDGALYIGTYPDANMYRYDPTQPYDLGTNPKPLFSLASDGQDRPFAVADAGSKVAFGTVATYGSLQGALALYDPTTDSHTVFTDVVSDQSITALAYRDGKLYGGTSIYGGLGTDPTASAAELFVWDMSTNTVEWSGALPGGSPSVLGLTFDGNGTLWGTTGDGHVFSFDPATSTFGAQTQIVKAQPTDHSWPDSGGQIFADPDGDLYGAFFGVFFRLAPDTLDHQILRTDVSHLAPAPNGYYLAEASTLSLWTRL